MVLATVFTANLSAFLIGSDVGKVTRDVEKVDKDAEAGIQEIMARLDRIEQLLEEKRH